MTRYQTKSKEFSKRSTVTNDDGEEVELFDLRASHEKSMEDKFWDELSFVALVDKIDCVFINSQERQKRLLSMLLTIDIIKACDEDLDKAKAVLCGKELFNEEVIEYYNKNGEFPTRVIIGEMCGKTGTGKTIESSLSRAYADFKKKLK